MKHLLAAENLDVETPAIPHAHGKDKQQEYVAPKRTVVERVHCRKLCQDGIKELPTHERGFPVLRWEFRQERSNDAPFGIHKEEEGSCPLPGLDLLPPIDKDELPVQHLPDKI